MRTPLQPITVAMLQSLGNYAEEQVVPKQMYVASQPYRVRGRICDVPASAPTQLAVSVHLVVCKLALLSRWNNVCILARETLIDEPKCFGGCARLDNGGNLRRLVPE